MSLKHEQRPNCGIYKDYMIFDVTMGTDGKVHWALEFVKERPRNMYGRQNRRFYKSQHNTCLTQPISTKLNSHES